MNIAKISKWMLAIIIGLQLQFFAGGINVFAAEEAPTIASISPASAPVAYTKPVSITVDGANFISGKTTVTLFQNGQAIDGKITNINVISATKLSFTLATGLSVGSYEVKVSTPYGNNIVAFSIANPVISLNNSNLKTGYTGSTLEINGTNTNFVTGKTQVAILNGSGQATGKVSNVNVASNNRLLFTVSEGLAAGSYSVQVVTGEEISATPLVVKTTSISAVSPNEIPTTYTTGKVITITGTNTTFITGTDVRLIAANGSDASDYVTSVNRVSNTELNVTLSEGLPVGNYDINIISGYDTVNKSSAITVYQPSLDSPESLTVGYEGQTITINGTDTNFNQSNTRITLISANEFISNKVINSPTQVSLDLLPGLQAGSYTLKVETGEEVAQTSLVIVGGTLDSTPPAVPGNLTVEPLNQSVKLTWDRVSDSDLKGYKIYQKTGDGSFSAIATVDKNQTEYIKLGLTNGQAYSYKILAIDLNDNQSGYSNVVSATPQGSGSISDPVIPGPTSPTPAPLPVSVVQVEVQKKVGDNGKQSVVATVDAEELATYISEMQGNAVKIDLKGDQDIAQSETNIPANVFNNLVNKSAEGQLVIESSVAAYHLNANDFSSSALAEKGLRNVQKVVVSIDTSDHTSVKEVEDKKVANIVSFKVVVVTSDKTVEVDQFNGYVERELAVQTSTSTEYLTGVRINEDGSYTTVPTTFSGNKAIIKSRTNSQYTVIENKVSFTDISKNYWAKVNIEKLGNKLIYRGKDKDKFVPEDTTTRAEVAVLLVRSLGLSLDEKYNGKFTDVKGKEWFINPLVKAVDAGLISGYGDGSFKPNEKITREQTAAMIARAMKFVGYDSSMLDQTKTLNQFKDSSKLNSMFKSDIELMVKAGIFGGDDKGNFNPKGYTTRAEMAAILDRFLTFEDLG